MFDEVYGQDYVKRYLENSVRQGRISNAYLFDGIEGCGKMTTAVKLAEYLCGSRDDETSDIEIYRLNEGESSHKIELIRSINSSITLKPLSDYKVIIIDDADKLTVQAQNAFLKNIEEPPLFVIIILVASNRDSILDTIRSRCEIIKFKALSENEVFSYLMDNGANIDDAKAISKYSNGSITRANDLIGSNEFSNMRKDVKNIMEVLLEDDIDEKLRLIDVFSDRKSRIYEFLDMIIEVYLDFYIIKRGLDASLISNIDNLETIKKINKSIIYYQISKIIDIIEEAKIKLRANCNFNITINNMVLEIDEVI